MSAPREYVFFTDRDFGNTKQQIYITMNLRAEIRPELWEATAKPYESEIFSNAILEAIHYLSNILRERANVDGDGASLVGQALGGDSPRLRINKFQTETEKNEQKGLEQILRGVYQGIRTPRSHEQFEDTQASANAIILFIDYLLSIVSQAKEPFTLEEWSKRVFDPDFVASDRYAQLLASEVPPKKYIDALITTYRNKMSGDGEKLTYIFKALIDLIGDDKLGDFLAIVSDELKVTQEDNVIEMILQILPNYLWPRIEEVARIRIENKLIRSSESGKYNPSSQKSIPGWLGAWARDFIKYFTLKAEVSEVIWKKLQGSEEDRNYVAQFFFWVLPHTLEHTDTKYSEFTNNSRKKAYTDTIAKAVSVPLGTNFLRDKLVENFYNFPSDWQDLLIEKLTPLKESDPEYFEKINASKDLPF